MSWQLYPAFAVRAAGFPVGLLEDLTTAELTEAVSRHRDAAAAAEELRGRLLREELPAAVRAAHGDRDALRALSRIRERVGRRRTGISTGLAGHGELPALLREWSTRQDAAAALLAPVTAAAAASERRTAAQLARLAARPDVQGALLLLSPSFCTAVQRRAGQPARPGAQDWAYCRRLALYLQRLAARNETHSYFGPVGYGHVDPAAGGLAVDGQAGAGPPGVFATHRLAAGLAAAIERSGAVPPRPRRVPAARRAGPHLVTHRGQIPLGDLGGRLWDLADGSRTSAELAAAAAGTADPAAAAAVLSQLLAAGALAPAPVVDPRSADPLACVERRLAGTPAAAGRWPEVIAEFRRLLRDFAAAPVPGRLRLLEQAEERYRAVTGAEPRAGAGRMYADRTLLFEERPSACKVRLGPELAERIRAGADAALSLWAAASAERHAVLRHHAAAVFAAAFGEASEVPFLDVLRTLRGHPAPGPVSTSVHRQMAERISRCPGPCLDLDSGAAGLIAGPAAPHLFSSIDLLLARTGPAPDDLTVVIGEAHPMNLLSVFPTDYYARRDTPQRCADRDAWLLERITPPGTRLAQLIGGRTAKIFAYPQAVVPVELRPRLPTAAATPVADLTVRRAGQRLALRDAAGELVLLPALTGGDETDPLTVFSLPAVGTTVFGTGPRLPRITIGGAVLQRRRWETRLPELPSRLSRAGRYGAVIRWWAEQGLPRRVFVRAGAEPKPVCIDAASPVLVGCLISLGAGTELVITEMLPDAGQCWLAGPEGQHTCEFRFLAAGPGG